MYPNDKSNVNAINERTFASIIDDIKQSLEEATKTSTIIHDKLYGPRVAEPCGGNTPINCIEDVLNSIAKDMHNLRSELITIEKRL